MSVPTAHTNGLAAGIELRISGTVQGVGFRPLVSRLAEDIALAGDVKNTSEGVLIRLFGPSEKMDRFIRRLKEEPPSLARIETVEQRHIVDRAPSGFRILESTKSHPETAIAADAAVCKDCVRELFDPADRRFRYPFLNCTQCGPRYSIQQAVPYDRASTTMGGFPMCDDCLAEYRNPADRRFHAEATACPQCGPQLWLERVNHPTIHHRGDEALQTARRLLLQNKIVAIKGLGGFHLACRTNDDAVARLRERKRRPRKPLALMVRDSAAAAAIVELTGASIKVLESVEAPIVLARLKPKTRLSSAIAPGLDQVGVMLPYTPLHALLFEHLDEPLVMTSGNARGDPQIVDNDQARRDLAAIADAFLMHDRPIASRIDDSLVQMVGDQIQILRRARGYASRPLRLPAGFPVDHPDVLAMGGDIKNAVAVAQRGSVTLSPYVGDLEQAKTFEDLKRLIDITLERLDSKPDIVAMDNHPSYRSSEWGQQQATTLEAVPIAIQHHHAHAAACMVEHGVPLDHPPIAAIVLDGLGMGDEGALWGGEILLSDYRSSKRIACLKAAPLLGGDQAAREPWRNLMAQLLVTFGPSERWPSSLRSLLTSRPVDLLVDAWRAGLNAPDCTSAGRLFDAVAASLNLVPERQDYEGEAAMRLQALATNWLSENEQPDGYPVAMTRDGDGPICIDPTYLWQALADDLSVAAPTGYIAVRFHLALAEALTGVLSNDAIPHRSTVALSGGVCQNVLLSNFLRQRLVGAGFKVLESRVLPANDGGLAVGQAAIAIARSIA